MKLKDNSIKKLVYLEGFTNFDTLINCIKVTYILSFVFNDDIIAINKTAMLIAIFLFEVPSGYFSDKFGDKKTFILAKLFSITSLLFIIFFKNEWGVVVSFIILGMSTAFESGARNSYYRRLCKARNIDYKAIKLNISQKSNILKLVLSILGSIFYVYNMYLPFVITLIVYIISLFALLALPSDGLKMYEKEESLLNTTKDVFTELIHDYNIFIEFIVYTFLTALLILAFDYYQLFFKSYNIPVYLFGSIYATFRILAYLGVSAYKKNFSKNMSVLLISVSFIFIYLQNIYLFVISVILQEIFYSFENARFDIILLEKLEEENKGAHYESVVSFVYSIFRILILSFTAFILNYVDLYDYFFACSLVVMILFFIRKYTGNKVCKKENGLIL